MESIERSTGPSPRLGSAVRLGAALLLGLGLLGGCAGRGSAALSTDSASAGGSLTTASRPDGLGPKVAKSRFTPAVCEGYDLSPDARQLTVDDVVKHLRAVGLDAKSRRERENLHLVDVSSGGKTVRLRVATLDSAREAGRDLHVALLEHGNGYWGVHRSNLAVLATPGPDEPDGAFLVASKLHCWGIFTTAGRDDTFVVPGGYFEL